jgi:epoxyqueuosine reductase
VPAKWNKLILMQSPASDTAARIKAQALRLGFCDCGISRTEKLTSEAVRFNEWLNAGFHAGMGYMAKNPEKRTDPSLLLEGCRSVISVLLNYYTLMKQEDPQAPVVSRYAYGRDYHDIVRDKLNALVEYIRSLSPDSSNAIFVDTAPLAERTWAVRAGTGWIGKNSNLISPKYGSFVFIGTVLTDLGLEYDKPREDRCGTCTRCIEACPTNAIVSPHVIDSRRCISYLTIENKGEINAEFRELMQNRVFGCDICQDVCPWNSRVIPHSEKDLEPLPGLLQMRKEEWLSLNEEDFKTIFKDSPVKRAKYHGIRRNLDFISGEPARHPLHPPSGARNKKPWL